MLTAISRYGVRVIPNTMQVIADLDRRGQLIEGPHIGAFESAFAARLGVPWAVATAYGRMAFYYLLKAMALPPGSEVVFPALTFWVMPEMARVSGLTPVFADVDPVSFNMTADALERAITPRTVAVVPTHLWGLPCDMDEILAVARRRGLRVIEDCAHALGARYRGRPVGTLGDAAIFSFQTLKPLNAYGGGMVVTADPGLGTRVADLVSAEPAPDPRTVKERLWHGRVLRIATRPSIFTWTLFPLMYACERLHSNLDVYFWEKIRALDPLPRDYRERMSNVQAAIALEGLALLDVWTSRTQQHARRMTSALEGLPHVRVPSVPGDRTHAFYQYCVYLEGRDRVVEACLHRGVDLETLHVDLCTDLELFGGPRRAAPGTRKTTETIQIPIHESLDDRCLDRVATVLGDVVHTVAAEGGVAVRQA
jgi:dTDP-4-amino-4,6-dideoxygalactose transaminase